MNASKFSVLKLHSKEFAGFPNVIISVFVYIFHSFMRFARTVGCNDHILNLTTISSLLKNSKVKILEGTHGVRKTFFHLMYGKNKSINNG